MHEHHRSRMKERYKKDGFDNFAIHEILEMLLFYGKPQGNTNPCAHELLEHFGSFRNVLEAPIDELVRVNGIGEHTAILLKLITEAMRRYAFELSNDGVAYNRMSMVADRLGPYFIGLDHECLYMMLLNNRLGLIECVCVSEGVVNCSEVSIRKMTEIALRKNASCVILAHNHPHGAPIASGADLAVTEAARDAFSLLDIEVIEHLIFADGAFSPILKKHYGGDVRTSPHSDTYTPFYERFYDLRDKECFVRSYFDSRSRLTRK